MGGAGLRLTVPRMAGGRLDRSPLGLEPDDSRHNRGMAAAAAPYRRPAEPEPVPAEAGEPA
jgi:two-component system, OmpR family, sensor histidine kinase MtrB